MNIQELLDELPTAIKSGDSNSISGVLSALKERGLSQMDLVVHVERLRAVNEVTEDDADFEESCLLALDIIHGETLLGLEWV